MRFPIVVLCLLGAILASIIIYIIIKFDLKREHKSSSNYSSSGTVPLDKHKQKLKEIDTLRSEKDRLQNKYDKLCDEYNDLEGNYKTACYKRDFYKEKLKRLEDEMGNLLGNTTKIKLADQEIESDSDNSHEPKKSDDNNTLAEETSPKGEYNQELSKEVVRYASFPRSAGNRIYFSDLSESMADDSYFELRISIPSDKALFKPIDFMKIRNYDAAMSAMITEGVKPNIASNILGIEPGIVYIEGKDWIIECPAKIKLA